MKKIFTLVAITLLSSLLLAQSDSKGAWNLKGIAVAQFNQAGFKNWAGGGQNSIAILFDADFEANYKKGHYGWENKLSENYGLTQLGESSRFLKTQDILELNTKFTRNYTQNSRITVFADLMSQITTGYSSTEPDFSDYTTNFFAPAYVLEGIAYEYKNDSIGLSTTFSVITGKETFVFDNGVNEVAFGLDSGATSRTELGTYLRIIYEKKILERTTFKTNLLLFSNYLENFGNIDVNWKTKLTVEANKWLAINLQSHVIYDDDIDLPNYESISGIETITGAGPKIQWAYSIGLAIRFGFTGESN